MTQAFISAIGPAGGRSLCPPADRHDEFAAVGGPVDGGHGPGDADAEEDVDGVGAGDVAHGGVGRLVLDGGSLGGERV